MPKQKSRRRRKKSIIKQLLILFILALILGGGYYYIKQNEKHPKSSLYNNGNEEYVELEIQNPLKYKAVVIYKNNTNINEIANTFYNSSIFWPYIFIENKEVITNPLNIESDMLIKIPRLADSLTDLSNAASVRRAKLLADSILENAN